MKHWTQDVVPGAGVVLMAAGVALAKVASVWGGVACVALGVVLLVALRVAEYRADVRRALEVDAKVDALLQRMAATEEATKKAHELAEASASGVRELRAPKRGMGY